LKGCRRIGAKHALSIQQVILLLSEVIDFFQQLVEPVLSQFLLFIECYHMFMHRGWKRDVVPALKNNGAAVGSIIVLRARLLIHSLNFSINCVTANSQFIY